MADRTPTYETATSRVWHVRTAESSGGDVHEQLVEYLPGSPFPPTHHHPDQDEHFEIQRGSMIFVLDGEERVVATGETIEVPRGTRHRTRSCSRLPSGCRSYCWER